MSTKTTMRLIQISGIFLPLFGLLASVTHQTVFFVLACALASLILTLLGYAWFRENFRNDKSI